MIYILEGPSGVGKTTLARYLVQNYGFSYFKDSIDGFNDMTRKQRAEATKLSLFAQTKLLVSLAPECNIIVDRFHLSEYVYGRVRRFYAVEYMDDLEFMMAGVKEHIKLVYILGTLSELEARDQIVNSDYIDAVMCYDKAFKNSILKKVSVRTLGIGAQAVMGLLGLAYNGTPFEFGEGKAKV